ncbi:hypothetical protein SERLA73DRAFT_177853 [Serpula lacrymans var. lacrymans S7.3]|uniref:Vacuolar membrane protein n=2 Tax=Serpula lacrymans var. lacrymans TaxID=341189 RepID=F8PPQ1_SERL3|nr:uncharacterized protein SERLADRAFT_461667 [Serpula lacrymans var. lacrymans S7.9]EGO02109.1 hypothetical protein SERLA73DRAFT_177853 [Serpula lacrymans var. lacrymans S7.3]EGO27732.1 hypothetical protein SERLADRAFT_461667 [Serpula lacrymans var. lacrymans S7.9]
MFPIFRATISPAFDENTSEVEPPFEDYPVDRSCRLLGPTALIVQALMGVLVILSLVYKRHRETSKRPWRIWLFDVSKQIVGQMFVHGVNVFISDIGSHHSSGNACVYYFLNILIDTTFGVALLYFILHLLNYLLTATLHLKGFESGKYGSPPSMAFWARQAAVYVLALTTMKLSVVALFAAWPGIAEVGDWLLSWTNVGDGEAFQVIFTMGLFPIFMNILQFWLIDSIVKASSSSVILPTDTPRNSHDNRDREPLFGASSDEDDDDDASGHLHHDVESAVRPSYSRSPSDGDKSTIIGSEENKSIPSGSATPIEIKNNVNVLSKHEYPPSSAGSSLSSRRTGASSKSRHKYKRSPPPPLQIRLPHQPAINSPDPSALRLSSHSVQPHSTVAPAPIEDAATVEDTPEQEDSSWETDDWATRVGEEEWTGRRLEEKKDLLNEAWNTPSVQRVGS